MKYVSLILDVISIALSIYAIVYIVSARKKSNKVSEELENGE